MKSASRSALRWALSAVALSTVGGLGCGGPSGTDAAVVTPDAYAPDAFRDRPDTGPTDICGDGRRTADEACDDGNTAAGDGCSASCDLEAGWTCNTSSPNRCSETCGDGMTVGDEDGANGCDDGNTMAGDGCSASCSVESGYSCAGTPSECMTGCGDGVVAGTEECDDGDMADDDGCSAACAVEPGYTCTGRPSTCTSRCGDGMLGGTEVCDDGNTRAGDGCSAMCAPEAGWNCSSGMCVSVCGDSMRVGMETCDDGNTVTETCTYGAMSCMVCNAMCQSVAGATSVCGDSRTDAAREMCDDGNTVTETGCPSGMATCTVCNATCTATVMLSGSCGDRMISATETCDDGNSRAGDGCSASCQTEPGFGCSGTPSVCTTRCGDSMVGGTETCDDGNNVTDGCPYMSAGCSVCNAMCQTGPGVLTFCQDGVVNGPEACDDGNNRDGDGCQRGCTVTSGWSCTPGTSPSVCAARCGDRLLAVGAEACDDGNTTAGDGCSATCAVESGYMCSGIPSACVSTCGDRIRASNEACDDGNTRTLDGCSDRCTVEAGWSCAGAIGGISACAFTCGNGRADPGEGCEDGNAVASDGCTACQLDPGYTCTGVFGSQVCATVCGDGIIAGAEQCDDNWRDIPGATGAGGDGCSATCRLSGSPFTCSGSPSSCGFNGVYTGATVMINDNSTTTIPFATPSVPSCRIGSIANVSFRMSHTWVGDMAVTLISPSGSTASVFDRPGLDTPTGCCGSGSDLSGVYVFSEFTGTAPFPEAPPSPVPNGPWYPTNGIGAVAPMSSVFTGQAANGTWQLRVLDGAGGDLGTYDTINLRVICLPN